jgi:hypothetical protein
MACGAPFETHDRVLKRERTALVPMAIDTTRFVRSEGLTHRRLGTTVRVVAIDAGHGSLGEFVVGRPLKLGPDIDVATRALLVDGGRLASHQAVRAIGVDFVAARAGDLILHMAALQTPHVRRFV